MVPQRASRAPLRCTRTTQAQLAALRSVAFVSLLTQLAVFSAQSRSSAHPLAARSAVLAQQAASAIARSSRSASPARLGASPTAQARPSVVSARSVNGSRCKAKQVRIIRAGSCFNAVCACQAANSACPDRSVASLAVLRVCRVRRAHSNRAPDNHSAAGQLVEQICDFTDSAF